MDCNTNMGPGQQGTGSYSAQQPAHDFDFNNFTPPSMSQMPGGFAMPMPRLVPMAQTIPMQLPLPMHPQGPELSVQTHGLQMLIQQQQQQHAQLAHLQGSQMPPQMSLPAPPYQHQYQYQYQYQHHLQPATMPIPQEPLPPPGLSMSSMPPAPSIPPLMGQTVAESVGPLEQPVPPQRVFSAFSLPRVPEQSQVLETAEPAQAFVNPPVKTRASRRTNRRSSQLKSTAPRPLGRGSIRRRSRPITSCGECRIRKVKCSRGSPCTNCTKSGLVCSYMNPEDVNSSYFNEMKDQVQSLERRVMYQMPDVSSPGSTDSDSRSSSSSNRPDIEGPQPSLLVVSDMAYGHLDSVDAATIDNMIDLGMKVGRVRFTERIGGLYRPRMAQEIEMGLTGKITQATDPLSSTPDPDAHANSGKIDIDFLLPSENFINPDIDAFSFSDEELSRSYQYLPSPATCDYLKDMYFNTVHPIAPCLHRPSFERQYATFMKDMHSRMQLAPHLQALIFSVLFSSTVALGKDMSRDDSLIKSLRSGFVISLKKALRAGSSKIEAMQAFVIYLVPLCRDEISRSHSLTVGTAIHYARSMGLDKDGESFGLTALDSYVRRLLWHQLCFLDIRTCEAQGPVPAIRRDEYTTRIPQICNDSSFLPDETLDKPPKNEWASSLPAVIRSRSMEMMRVIWNDRRKLEKKELALHTVMDKLDKFQKKANDKYAHRVSGNESIQKYTKLVMTILLHRLDVMVLHPYHANARGGLPEDLRNRLILSGVTIIESAIELETNIQYAKWRWYLGALMQYQVAFLLTTEIFYRRQHPYADRIWPCLHFVFGVDPSKPPEEKSREILKDIMRKCAIYGQLRQYKVPISVATAVPSQQAVQGSSTESPSTDFIPARSRTISSETMLANDDIKNEYTCDHAHENVLEMTPEQPQALGEQFGQLQMQGYLSQAAIHVTAPTTKTPLPPPPSGQHDAPETQQHPGDIRHGIAGLSTSGQEHWNYAQHMSVNTPENNNQQFFQHSQQNQPQFVPRLSDDTNLIMDGPEWAEFKDAFFNDGSGDVGPP